MQHYITLHSLVFKNSIHTIRPEHSITKTLADIGSKGWGNFDHCQNDIELPTVLQPIYMNS